MIPPRWLFYMKQHVPEALSVIHNKESSDNASCLCIVYEMRISKYLTK